MNRQRLPYWDNIKGILILLVVFGHLLQLVPGGSETAVFKWIYSFHMPLFVFCSGRMASFAPKKILTGLVLPYLLLQTVCCLSTGQTVQFITPYWMLWYLPALAVWRFSVPLLSLAPKKAAPVVVLLLAAIGCAVGYVDKIGYAFTLSRIFVFAPYFAAGFYVKNGEFPAPEQVKSPAIQWRFAALASALSVVCIVFAENIRAEWLYGTYGYASGEYNVLLRAAQYVTAAVIGAAILLLTPKQKTVFTVWGRESFTLYIAHIAFLPVMQSLFPKLPPPLQYAVCVLASATFCAVVPWVKTQVMRLKTAKH